MLAVTASARASAATLAGEVRLSQELRTPPLPEAHVLVGYCWQNSRCCQPSPLAAAQLHQRLRVAPEPVILLLFQESPGGLRATLYRAPRRAASACHAAPTRRHSLPRTRSSAQHPLTCGPRAQVPRGPRLPPAYGAVARPANRPSAGKSNTATKATPRPRVSHLFAGWFTQYPSSAARASDWTTTAGRDPRWKRSGSVV